MTAPDPRSVAAGLDRAREIARQVVKDRGLQRDNGVVYSAALGAALIALTRPSPDRASIRAEAFEEAAKVAETPFDGAVAPSHKQIKFREKIATAIRALATKEPSDGRP